MELLPLLTLSQLESYTCDELDDYARQAVRQLSTRKLLLGRVLVALDRKHRARRLGCSSSIHYARLLGVEYREALEVRRVARRLEELPLLRAAAEEGQVPWAALREIVRKASEKTEAKWLELAGMHPYKTIERLVRATRKGEMPGDADQLPTMLPLEVMMRFLISHVGAALVDKVIRALGERLGTALSLGEGIEWLCVWFLTGTLTDEARDRCSSEILKDAAAARAVDDEVVRQTAEEPARVSENVDGQTQTFLELCPSDWDLTMVNWENPRLRYNPEARLTPAQRRELLRRDGYCCSAPGCPNRLWLAVHHLVFFSLGGATIPVNLLVLCSTCHRNLHRGWLRVHGLAPFALMWADRHGRRLMRARLVPGWWDEEFQRGLAEMENPSG